VPYRDRPRLVRDCLECGEADAMELQNTARTQPTNIPLLYTCRVCGCTLTIPPEHSPVTPPARRGND
jgi:hypothetical protein